MLASCSKSDHGCWMRTPDDDYATRFREYQTSTFIKGAGILLLMAMGVAFVSRVAKNFQDYYVNVIVQRVGAEMYSDGIRHSLELPYSVFEDQRSGETLGKLQKVRSDVERFISLSINLIFTTLVGVVFVIIYALTVHWVKARNLPPLDDEFATTLGMDYETVDALRAAIRDNLQTREEHERRLEHEEQVIQAVVDQATVDLPPQLTEEEADRLLQQTAQNLERQGIPLQSYLRFTQKSEEQFRAELMTQAERNVRRTEVLNAVAQAEGIEISDEEINAELAQSSDDPAEVRRLIREAARRPAFKERIAAMMRRQRATRLLLETVGGVDFAALEAEAAAEDDEDELDGQLDDAVAEAAIVRSPADSEDTHPEENPVATEAPAEAATPAVATATAEQAGPPSGPPSSGETSA